MNAVWSIFFPPHRPPIWTVIETSWLLWQWQHQTASWSTCANMNKPVRSWELGAVASISSWTTSSAQGPHSWRSYLDQKKTKNNELLPSSCLELHSRAGIDVPALRGSFISIIFKTDLFLPCELFIPSLEVASLPNYILRCLFVSLREKAIFFLIRGDIYIKM